VLEGSYCRLEPIDVSKHARDLFDAYTADSDHRMWTYLYYGPFETLESFENHLRTQCLGDDPLCFAIVDRSTDRALGMGSYLRIDCKQGVIEVGGLTYSPALQRTPLSTEAMYLMMKRAFDELGYRRYEWKCDALNAPSLRAAERLGFQFEGVFRQAAVYKGRNRNTAWLSILDSEWPRHRAAFEQWLAPENFAPSGAQVRSLAECRDSVILPDTA
jgi:RimJ/RimL family protein N-acetyltransferase